MSTGLSQRERARSRRSVGRSRRRAGGGALGEGAAEDEARRRERRERRGGVDIARKRILLYKPLSQQTGSDWHYKWHSRKRILKIQASLTAHWHDKGADWRGLAHTQAHHRSRLSDSVKNGNALSSGEVVCTATHM